MSDDAKRRALAAEELDPSEITTSPDGEPLALQPIWRGDFPIDAPVDQYVARRNFARLLVLTSGAFVAGQAWLAAKDLVRKRRAPPPRITIATLKDIPVGASLVFHYPTPRDRCLLLRPEVKLLVAYSQACTHLSCAVVPRMSEGVLHCPCHQGYFDLRTGQNIAGPPPRPLPRILLTIEGTDVIATGVEERMV
ncbi:ubiquinol-cytochrome c reductase iron-sulfur subunit [Pendulispora albinea]|uniref:Rieske 2Fe-2S domain-containing protein n=1 Tax=Pendulispora albinea TaxID=2741071 RepID=A0ABZ2LUW9_9BACT